MRQGRRNFQAHVAIAPLALLVNRPEQVRRILDIAHREPLVERLGVELLCLSRVKQLFVVGAASDRLFEDGRVRGNTAQSIFFDKPLQFAAGNQTAANVIEPDGLSVLLQL